ncbi:uncharacterized protein F5891DRAFT_1186519 [Suillus fuscotomentosus]|uniref:Uncharacterized protein n=1 Tax=Suillus fuscotomentosus TaxID=1912939 RepID=A0AAD4E9X3_9AGAM|nr:uncharacterized protein F5891DRAFT_1186519 [Suillus fuscotomentosus]KAG1902408.1 hypothetical protein F5891DRAFT_1186519 [Suillus fuscotomentosus]
MAHVEHVEGEGSMAQVNLEDQQDQSSEELTAAVAASLQARQRHRIVQLEERLEVLEVGRAAKERQSNHYMAQGRAIRRIVSLFDNVEDLVTENDRRYDLTGDEEVNVDQDRLQVGYVTLTHTLPWFHKKAVEMEYDEYVYMMKMVGFICVDDRHCDDTSKLKALISEWVNREFKPEHPVDPDNKHSHGFINDACGRLLCLAKIDWNNPIARAGIRDRTDGYIVTDLSFPAFLYDKYTANPDDLEEGLFKGKILLQDIEGDGDGADVIQNNILAKKSAAGVKVKKHVMQIIKMRKVTPQSIAYIVCQVNSFGERSVDGDFDYIQFWRTIMDFFECPPGQEARCRVDRLLGWWTRKVFGRNYREDLSSTAKENMSVNALARQRAQRDDLSFDSP